MVLTEKLNRYQRQAEVMCALLYCIRRCWVEL